MVRAAIQKIVANKDYTHEGVRYYNEVAMDNVDTIYNKLVESTVDIKEAYIKASIEYAERTWKFATEQLAKPKMKQPEARMEYSARKGYHNVYINEEEGKLYERERARRIEWHKDTMHPLEETLKREERSANEKYVNATRKLAERIQVKELNVGKMQIIRGKVSKGNLEVTITDGEKTVRAFTILAWGMIVRPHYRYLIK
jgi:hypothetical protein